MKNIIEPPDPKVIPIKFDASLYSERALQAWDRLEYNKALKYCKIAIEKDFNNVTHHYHLASILAEMGCFEESNQALIMILTVIDPKMHDCLYYLANNYAYMGELHKAEENLVKYLEALPDGDFAVEAREMLMRICEELGRPTDEDKEIKNMPFVEEHDMACALLEAGEFELAIEQLLPIATENEDFLAAWNNLSLAYYYIGDYNSANLCTKHVLEKDPDNINALCNVALTFKKLGDEKQVKNIMQTLSNIIPLDIDLTYKLANTLGMLGEDYSAYKLLKGMLHHNDTTNIYVYHYLAVACINLKKLNKAIDYWNKAAKIDPNCDVINCFLKIAENEWRMIPQQNLQRLAYSFLLPFEELFLYNTQKNFISKLNKAMRTNKLTCFSYIWALEHGSEEAKESAKQLSIQISKKKLTQILKPFLNPETKYNDISKKMAIRLIKIAEREAPTPIKDIVIDITDRTSKHNLIKV